MITKFLISGKIEIVTGLHIGTGGEFSAIGATDSPVIRDAYSSTPIIPGISLKGKLRSLLAMQYNTEIAQTAEQDCQGICKLFGGKVNDNIVKSRLLFSDMSMTNIDELRENDVKETEIKFENTIKRLTGEANPRQIERVIRGSMFDLDIIYNAYEVSEIYDDMKMLADGLKLLEYDYLGGHGSRGYGKIKFNNLAFKPIMGSEVSEDTIRKCSELFEEI